MRNKVAPLSFSEKLIPTALLPFFTYTRAHKRTNTHDTGEIGPIWAPLWSEKSWKDSLKSKIDDIATNLVGEDEDDDDDPERTAFNLMTSPQALEANNTVCLHSTLIPGSTKWRLSLQYCSEYHSLFIREDLSMEALLDMGSARLDAIESGSVTKLNFTRHVSTHDTSCVTTKLP